MSRRMRHLATSMAFRPASIKAGPGTGRIYVARRLAGWVLAIAIALIALPAHAATFQAQRGINLDIWVTWPDESRWGEEGVLLPFPEWRRTLDAAGLEKLKADGFDFVRIPIDPRPFLSDRSARFHDRLYGEVLDAVRLVEDAGLKAIVDLHLFPTGSSGSVGMGQVMDDPALFDRYLDVVRRMAGTLKAEDPERIALELMNEPVAECGPQDAAWPERLQRLYAAARASATRLTLVLTGACWGTAEGLAAIDPAQIPDDNVIWSFPTYAPFLLTHQGATWSGDFIRYVTGIPYPPHAVPRAELDAAVEKAREKIRAEAPWLRQSGMLAYLDEQVAAIDTKEELAAAMAEPFDTAAAWAAEHGIDPKNIILGEFGMIRQEWQNDFVMPPQWRAAYYRDMIALAETHGFAWSMWGYGGAFGVAEEFEGRPAEQDVLGVVRGLR